MKNIEYYNTNSTEYFNKTSNADLSELYAVFERHLPTDAKILDIGCGSGRDALHFKNKGYEITAFDAAEELVKLSKEYTGLDIICNTFEEFDTEEKFDGLWACSSFLHIEKKDMKSMLEKYADFLKPDGVFYLSFKYSDCEYEENGKHYSCYTEESFIKIIEETDNQKIVEIFTSEDSIGGREQKWLSVILKRDSMQ